MTIFALHGFLGLPQDWLPTFVNLKYRMDLTGIERVAVDLFRTPEIGPNISLAHWGSAFCSWVRAELDSPPAILLGYSMGGRLALHAMEADPFLFRDVIVLSTHPGLTTPEDRDNRRQQDLAWAERFLQTQSGAEFDELVREWNRLDVFVGSLQEPSRRKGYFDTQRLYQAMKNWSLSEQKDFLSPGNGILNILKQNPKLRLSWMFGDRDLRYKEVCANVMQQLGSQCQVSTVKQSGHRIHLDNPTSLYKKLVGILQN